MRRVLGTAGLMTLALGLAVGTAGTVAGQQGQTGYDDAVVLGIGEELPEGTRVLAIDTTGGADSFDQTLAPGDFVDVTADGFGPETKGTVEITSERRTLAFVTADDEGVIRQRVQIPDNIEHGDHTLHVVGVDADGNPRTVSMAVKVGVPGEGGSNWPAWTAGSIAAALGLLGFLYWRQGARQRTRHHEQERLNSIS